MKIWSTKRALTKGIEEFEVAPPSAAAPSIVAAHTPKGAVYFDGEGVQWHRTKEAAVARAEHMRERRIAVLTDQIKRLKRLKF